MNVEHLHAVPHLTTSLTGPLQKIETLLLNRQTEIEAWFRGQWRETPPPFYCSVDLRNAGFKLAPVDTNLFPAGFNNLNPEFQPLCIHAAQDAMDRTCPQAAKVLIIPESHTRNLFYWESFYSLCEILSKAGYSVRVGTLREDVTAATQIELSPGRSIRLEVLKREGDKLSVDDFTPCMILLNNDLSAGTPPILENLKQPVIPSLAMGWSQRLKSTHFTHYRNVARDFAGLIGIDPWLIDPLFLQCGEINFTRREGEDCLATNADNLLAAIQRKYEEHGIDKRPFVIVKADAGTYGMGIMTAHSGQELRELNRKQRTKMSASKGGQQVSKVIIQEGVYTFETWGQAQAVAEPVVYMMDRFVVGGFYRIHTARGPNENLNAPGMQFEPLAFADCCSNPDLTRAPDAHPNRFYAYGVIARLALVAAAREASALLPR